MNVCICSCLLGVSVIFSWLILHMSIVCVRERESVVIASACQCAVCDRKDESLVAASLSHRGIFVWRLVQAQHNSREAAPDRKRHGELCYDRG